MENHMTHKASYDSFLCMFGHYQELSSFEHFLILPDYIYGWQLPEGGAFETLHFQVCTNVH